MSFSLRFSAELHRLSSERAPPRECVPNIKSAIKGGSAITDKNINFAEIFVVGNINVTCRILNLQVSVFLR